MGLLMLFFFGYGFVKDLGVEGSLFYLSISFYLSLALWF